MTEEWAPGYMTWFMGQIGKGEKLASGSSNQRSNESKIMRLSTYGSIVDINIYIFQIGELIHVLIFGNADGS